IVVPLPLNLYREMQLTVLASDVAFAIQAEVLFRIKLDGLLVDAQCIDQAIAAKLLVLRRLAIITIEYRPDVGVAAHDAGLDLGEQFEDLGLHVRKVLRGSL